MKLAAVSLGDRDRLKPLFQFKGNCNVNLVSPTGLKMILVFAGLPGAAADPNIKHRDTQPFINTDELQAFVKNGDKPFPVSDYFTVSSQIVHYRIWITSEARKYFLEAIYQRVPGQKKENWRLDPLLWHDALNQDVPDVPVKSKPPEQKEDKDGS
jgi:hypothetical protein